jgi:hypothetical protein
MNQSLRREIFEIRRMAGFSSTVSLYRPQWEFHRPRAESLAGNPSIRRHNRVAAAKQIPFVRKLLAGSGFYLLRAQKNRWKYRTSTEFSPLPAAAHTFS